ncbi:MAG: transferase hexapeptide repeat family protein [Bacteroidetes bacterium]|nr:transferase hexapeptide repeat family protein [Bacteroidota bacterium]
MVYSFNGFTPVIDKTAFIHPTATITGNVTIGKKVYVGPSASLRGDWGEIIIEDGCNVQDGCILHAFPAAKVYLKKMAHIGHGSVIHGAKIGENTLIGMNSVVMDYAEIGDECIIGALTFIPAEMKIPPRKVVVGAPAKIIKNVPAKMLEWKTKGTKLYQQLTIDNFRTMKLVPALTKAKSKKKKQPKSFITWKETKNK